MIIPTKIASSIMSKLASNGFNGLYLFQFSSAIGIGSVTPIIGKNFTTTDVGLATGIGIGSGTGITVSSMIFQSVFIANVILEFGLLPTVHMLILSSAIGDSFEEEMREVTLTSNHSIVFNGNGVVNIPLVNISSNEIQNIMYIIGLGLGLLGPDWLKFCNAISKAIEQCFLLGIANVSISGNPNIPVPFPSSGSGSGIMI